MLGRKKKELHGKSDTLFMHAFAYQKCLNEDSSPQLLSYAKCFRLLISISSCNKEEFGSRYHKLSKLTSNASSSSSVLINCFSPSIHSSRLAFALLVTPALLQALLKLFMASSSPVLVFWTVSIGLLHSAKNTSNCMKQIKSDISKVNNENFKPLTERG